MKKKSILMFLCFDLIAVNYCIFAQNLEPKKINTIKMQSSDMPNEFNLYQERIAMPGISNIEQIYQFWSRDSKMSDLELVEDTKKKFDNAVGASLFQKWYRGDEKGKKDKIEINYVICISEKEMDDTITHFTKQKFATPHIISEITFAGDKSWVPVDVSAVGDTFSVMFVKSNVFIRLHVNLVDHDKNELKRIAKGIADNIEKNILMY